MYSWCSKYSFFWIQMHMFFYSYFYLIFLVQALTSCQERFLERPGCQWWVGEGQEVQAAQEPVDDDLVLALIR